MSEQNPTSVNLLKAAYDEYYKGNPTSDSPDASRLETARSIANFLINQNPASYPVTVLDLGAGKQPVEKQVRMLANSADGRGQYGGLKTKLAESHLITMDIAANVSHKGQPKWLRHVIGDSSRIPIREESVDLVVSNHSIDMLRADPKIFGEALLNVRKVLHLGGQIMFNYHHARLFEQLVDYYRVSHNHSPQAAYYNADARNPFYANVDDIEGDLVHAGLEPHNIYMSSDAHDIWWHVEAQRSN
jgi:ubiquinone/menaquinone biosynthesis C-methylase UbiE